MQHRLSVPFPFTEKKLACPFKRVMSYHLHLSFCLCRTPPAQVNIVECVTVGSFGLYTKKNSLSIQSDSLFGEGRQVGVCLHSENLFSWLEIKHNAHIHIYTRSITLTPDARKWSGDRVASTAKPYHVWLSPDFASFSKLAWSHHHSPLSPPPPYILYLHTHTHTYRLLGDSTGGLCPPSLSQMKWSEQTLLV